MKILRIRLKNLNSLKGDHTIDLTAEPLASAGLFAITGSTGAGKTTILDAITLALYGKAARYGNESNPEHVMTRHCGECSAEVEFEVPSGVYRAVWERRRARKKADGALQPPKRYIYDAAGVALAQQIREAEEKIESLIGLNYERFLRSVLLAQGDFAKFLKAKSSERATLLESLTGTEIYSRLGKEAHHKASDCENELKRLEADFEHIEVMEDEALKELENSIQQGKLQREKFCGDLETGSAQLALISQLEQARKREAETLLEQQSIKNDIAECKDKLSQLSAHRLTIPFTEELTKFDAAEESLKSSIIQQDKTKKHYSRAKDQLGRSHLILFASTESAFATSQSQAAHATKTVESEQKAATEIQAWLNQHQSDAELSDQLSEIVSSLGDLKNARKSLSRSWEQWANGLKEILPNEASKLPDNIQAFRENDLHQIIDPLLTTAESNKLQLLTQGQEARNQLDLREDHLTKSMLVASLEDHRHNLTDASPCPLCGALEHPYSNGDNAPNPEISELEKEVQKAKGLLEEKQKAYRSFESILNRIVADKDGLIKELTDIGHHLQVVEDTLQPLALTVPDHGAEDPLKETLQQRERSYRKQLKESEFTKKRQEEAERKVVEATSHADSYKTKLEKLPALPTQITRSEIVDQPLPSVPGAEEDYSQAVQLEKTTAAQIADREKDSLKVKANFLKIQITLEKLIEESQFTSLDDLRSSRLSEQVARSLEALDNELQQRGHAAQALAKQTQKDISHLLTQDTLEGEVAAAFKASQIEMKLSNEELLKALTTQDDQLKKDASNKNILASKQKELEERRKNMAVWRRLRDLIGSHDGSKFRKFAQSISLDILTRHANKHLTRLSERYQIDSDKTEELNLQIEDLHQAGTKRPMESLSGGESFLVSLALALGLSDLAGRTVRIDSLFVDEGFGSLDPESLDIAIDALESLRQDHKTVGVISHVSLLKERIGTQIVVEKQAGGVSLIRVTPELST